MQFSLTCAIIFNMKRTRILSQEKRVAIIEAAVTEFERVGYETASMDKIAFDANVSKATVYNHFGSKKELFLALIMQLKNALDEYHAIKYDAIKSIEEQLKVFAEQDLEFVCNPRNMTLMRIGINALMNECEVTPFLRELSNDHLFNNLIQWFNDAKIDGKLSFEDATFVTQQFMGNIKCFAFYPQVYGGAKLLEQHEWKHIIDNAIKIIVLLYSIK